MKNANRRLLISLAALVIAIALAATTTFAWFTMDTTPEVNDIYLVVTTQGGLYISFEDGLGSSKTFVEVGEGTKNMKAVKLNSTTMENAFIKLKDGTVGDSEAAADTDYFKTRVHISSTSNYSVHLQSVKITPDPAASPYAVYAWRDITAADINLNTWTEEDAAIFENAEGLTIGQTLEGNEVIIPKDTKLPAQFANIKNSLRIGFAIDGTMVKVFNPANGEGWEAYSFNAAHDYFNYKNGTTLSSDWTTDISSTIMFDLMFDQNDLPPESEADLTEDDLTEANMIVDSLGEIIADSGGWRRIAIDIYIWVEGTDVDCFNALLATDFQVDLVFAGKYLGEE
ncbi:MAG: hypothetical protein GX095_07280 [Clostridiales bacterium]|nr:hypothetical protein [Clostridiales bacterium]